MAATDTLGPCGWDVPDDVCCDGWADKPAQVRDMALRKATAILFALSGARYQRCETVYRPCIPRHTVRWPWIGPWMLPVSVGGSWINLHGCSEPCSCAANPKLALPGWFPEPTEVMVDGVVLAPTAYQVHNGRYLVRVDGGSWPVCQDTALPPSEAGTVQVTYLHGIPVPPEGLHAAAAYACEIAKLCVGEDCALPKRVQSLTRQGVELQLVPPEEFTDAGLTGVPAADEWLRSVNPTGQRRESRVWSPELPTGVVVTWP